MDYTILVNVKYKDVVQTNYDLKQQDYGQKLIVIAEDYDINGTTASLFINKSDGTVNERIMLKDNDSYTYILDADDTSSAGKTVFDVKYYKQGVRDSSASFIFNIIPDRFGNLIESKTMSDSLQSALDRVDRTIEIVDEYDEKIEQINKASGRAENAATNSVIAVANCEQATNKANVATDRANTAAATAEGIAENKTGVNDNAVGASTTWSSSKINTSLANQIGTANGASINLPNTYNGGLLLKELQGKSVQNGTPTPEVPVAIQSVGDNGNVVVKVCEKNLLPKTAKAATTIKGITFTPNPDGSILINGTATSFADFYVVGTYGSTSPIITLPAGNYVLSKMGNSGIVTHLYNGTTSLCNATTTDKTLTLTESKAITGVLVGVNSGVTITNQVVYPQLELGTTATTYEPYKEQLITIPLTQPLRSVGSVYDRGCVKSSGLWGNERKFAVVVLDGSSDEAWTRELTNTTGIYRFRCGKIESLIKRVPTYNDIAYILCNTYKTISSGSTYSKTTGIACETNGALFVFDSAYATSELATFTSKLASTPITVVYELATPTFEPFSQAIQDQLNKLQTYQGVTNVFTTDALQPTLSVSYGKTDSSALALYAENVSDNKVDKSSVANNLITTVEGTVLDGRQGKALSDKIGTLSNLTTTSKTDLVGSVNEVKASVDVVNNNLTNLVNKVGKVYTGIPIVTTIPADATKATRATEYVTLEAGSYIICGRHSDVMTSMSIVDGNNNLRFLQFNSNVFTFPVTFNETTQVALGLTSDTVKAVTADINLTGLFITRIK